MNLWNRLSVAVHFVTMGNATWITVLCSLAALIAVAFFYHGLERTRGRELHAQLIYWFVAVAVIVLLPLTGYAAYLFTALTATTIGTVFPIYESLRAVCTPEEFDDKAWLQYWIVGGILFIMTEWVGDMMGEKVVYWYGSLFFFFIWLFFPKTSGTLGRRLIASNSKKLLSRSFIDF